jgi:hypothetical protein
MKVGDRVKIRRGSGFFGQNDGIGAIVEINNHLQFPIYVQFADGYNNWYTEHDLELAEAEVFGGYKKLKSCSPQDVFSANPCQGEFEKYVKHMGSFYQDPPVERIISGCKANGEWLPWLIKKGFLATAKEDYQYTPVRVGDKFTIYGYPAMIVRLDANTVRLVHCDQSVVMWASSFRSVPVRDVKNISLDEFKQLFAANRDWEAIHKTRIPCGY